jgi:uncharacterized protein YfaS (alpha-2-macroglobulin family)
VRASDVADRCLLNDGNASVALHLVDGENAGASRAVAVVPQKPLERSRAYTLECDAALHGAEGPLGMAGPYREALHTYGDFTLVKASPTGDKADADDLDLSLELSNPTTVEEVSTHLDAAPAITGLRDGWLDAGEHRIYHVHVNLTPGQHYTVTLAAVVKDAFGQPLSGPSSFEFTAGDAQPRLSLKAGLTTVEASAPRVGLWTRNVGHLDIDAARVPESKIVPLVAAGGDDDDYGSDDNSDGAAPKPRYGERWRKLGVKPRHTRVTLASPKNKWQAGTLELAALSGGGDPRGVFAVSVDTDEDDARERHVIANVTNLGLVAKLGATSGLIWAVHLDDGKPAANVQVSIRDGDNKVRFSGVTSADGTVATPGRASLLPTPKAAAKLRDNEEYAAENEGASSNAVLYVLGHEGADLAVIGSDWQDGVASWSFNLPHTSGPAARLRGFIHTDRGLYRPSETVHIKGLARAVVPGEGLRVPKEKQAVVAIADAHGDEVLKKTLPLSPFGGFAVDLGLSAEARLGDWSVTATIGQGSDQVRFSDHFSVEEYRPVSFEVALKPARAAYELGQRPKVELKASYLYGAPLARGHVAFSVRRRDHLPEFAAFPNFAFSDFNALEDQGQWWLRYGERSYSYAVTDSEAELDNQGAATLRFATEDAQNEIRTAQDYLVEATVSDETHQSVQKSVVLVAHRSPFYLGLRQQELMPSAGKPFTVEGVAVDDDGKPRAAEATLVVTHRSWSCGWEQSSPSYGSDQCKTIDQELERRKVSLPGSGAIPLAITVAQPGTILISLRAPDGRGHEVVASDRVWTVGAGEANWRQSDDATFPLVSAQPRYRPGESARLVAQANMRGAAMLITIEREGVLRHEVRTFASSGQSIDLPISDADAPNVYASVVLVRGRSGDGDRLRPQLRMGLCNLEVDASAKRLSVQVSTDKPSYRPGETVRARVQVRAGDGAGVPAEVALAASDEGVLQLIGFHTPDAQAAFYAAVGLSVNSATNWTRLHRKSEPEVSDNEEGGDSGDSSGHLRTKFLSTAFWSPMVQTGADGSAEVTFTAPDNLTAFRVMAVAADAGDRFGSGDVRMTVQKPLSAQPALPRFFTVGDEAQAGVLVHNNTSKEGVVTVAAEGQGIVLLGERQTKLTVPAGGAAPARFTLRAGRVGTAQLTFHATLGNERDDVQLKVPIEQPSGIDVQTLGEGEISQPTTLALTRPQDALPDVGGLELTLDDSGLAGLDEGLRYLVEYPYGCLEQTTSRVIPMVKLDDLARSLALPGLRGAELRGFVEAGIAKILRHQHDDGSFSLWPGSRSEPFLTAFALWGLTQARRGGFAVDRKAIERGVAALAESLNGRDMGDSDNPLGEAGSRAFALYVLAELGHPDAGAMAKLFAARQTLPLFGEAFLARALARAHGDATTIDALVHDVTAAATAAPGGQRIADRNQDKLWWYLSSDTRTSAIALSLLLEVAPEHPLIAPLAKGLLAAREGGRWDNTQDNLFALVALADYARARAGSGTRARRVVVTLAGKTLLDGTFTKGHLVQRVRLPLLQLADGTLTITPVGGPLSYTARLRHARALGTIDAVERGFVIERRFVDPETKSEVSRFKTGQVVRVLLTVRAPEPRQRIAVVDHLPAGLEPINPRLKGDGEGEDHDDERVNRWAAMEQHDDRVALFADELWGDVLEFDYLARATTAGKFLLPAATVEEMYRPEHHARTASGTLEVRNR